MAKLQKILVVEDDLPLLQAIMTKLTLAKYTPIAARTADEAEQQLNDHPDIKVIWLDHYLIGEKNGLDLLKRIKDKKSKWQTIPVLVVSNSTTQEKEQLYKKIGVNKYFVKAETSLQEIVEEIDRLMR